MKNRHIALVVALILIAAAIYWLSSMSSTQTGNVPEADIPLPNMSENSTETYPTEADYQRINEKTAEYERAKELVDPGRFINSEPFAISDFIGEKVVLVDFWTYSCINCQRTTPYLNQWYSKYKDHGFVIIGIHTPEFAFEEDYDNLLAAVRREGIEYPVVQDNDYKTWRAYKNRFWPRKYLIDIDGFIVYDHIGEGAYEETELRIQQALMERQQVFALDQDLDMSIEAPEDVVDVDFSRVESPEIYFGAGRNEHLGKGIGEKEGIQNLEIPENIEKNQLYLEGEWDFKDEYAENLGKARIIFKFKAKDVNLVASANEAIELTIRQDSVLISTGRQVSGGKSDVLEEGLYNIISNADYGEHILEISIPVAGLKAYTFTFG